MTKSRLGSLVKHENGQSLIEAGIVLPLVLLIVLGTVEVGDALLDAHSVTSLSREGSNLISRGTTLEDAAVAMQTMGSDPVDFGNGSKVIFSVIKRGGTTGTSNYNRLILYQRYEFGSSPDTSRLSTQGAGSFGGGPDYVAVNSDDDTSLQITNVSPTLVTAPGGLIYVTEVFSSHTLITPLNTFGVTVPDRLYSIAYF